MLDLLRLRLRQGHQTSRYPKTEVALPGRFRGRPTIDGSKCVEGCRMCAEACPVTAISSEPLRIELGVCTFCPVCEEACPRGAIAYKEDHRLAARTRDALVIADSEVKLVAALDDESRRLFGRSLRLRQVSAGGCNGCEAELVALGNVVFDLARFGIQFVASPRHADGLVITGPVTDNMRAALLATFAATPSPRIVIALGACAISGGPFAGARESGDGVPAEFPVDLYVPGCPPHPFTIMDGLLRLLGKLG